MKRVLALLLVSALLLSAGQAFSAVPARAIKPFAKGIFKASGSGLALPAAVGIEARSLRIWREA